MLKPPLAAGPVKIGGVFVYEAITRAAAGHHLHRVPVAPK
jgi:hypothetical protein